MTARTDEIVSSIWLGTVTEKASCDGCVIPDRADFSLSDFGALASSILFLCRKKGEQFKVRLSGSDLDTTFGQNLNGMELGALCSHEVRPQLQKLLSTAEVQRSGLRLHVGLSGNSDKLTNCWISCLPTECKDDSSTGFLVAIDQSIGKLAGLSGFNQPIEISEILESEFVDVDWG